MFLAIAQQRNCNRVGRGDPRSAVLFRGAAVFARCLKFFPNIVIGTMLLLVAVNLSGSTARIITGRPGTRASPTRCTSTRAGDDRVHRAVRAILRGLLGPALGAARVARGRRRGLGVRLRRSRPVATARCWAFPTLLPFGMPHFDVVAAIPLMIFTVISMAEATGQTVVNAEIVGARSTHAPSTRTIRGDGLTSLLGGLFGTSLMVTSGENIGIVRASGVRCRFVTPAAGLILIVIGVVAPIGRAIAIPAPVVGGTAVVVYAHRLDGHPDAPQGRFHRASPNMLISPSALSWGCCRSSSPASTTSFPATAASCWAAASRWARSPRRS